MKKLTLENVRCFGGEHSAPLAPVTLLVGENSSGKSTFLAAVRLAWDLMARDPSSLDFNEEPFLLGSYDEIATLRGSKPSKSFTLGTEVFLPPEIRDSSPRELGETLEITGRFVSREGQPRLVSWRLKCSPLTVDLDFHSTSEGPSLTIEAPSAQESLPTEPFGLNEQSLRNLGIWAFAWLILYSWKEESSANIVESDLDSLRELLGFLGRDSGVRPYAFAPFRTRPRRTYDPLQIAPHPEGSHVPMVLARSASTSSPEWQALVSALEDFGEASGLFQGIRVRKLGKKTDPFQITVDIAGSPFNLTDVGYGVSQVLPLIVDAVRAEEGSTFLIQQPEVHLHPRAQAELGSFLATLAKTQNKRFVIETHSDYLVDRVRMDVRDREELSPEDVSLLYFERDNGLATIRHIPLDGDGNLVDVPPGYRRFFLEEERRLLLGGGD